MPTIRTTVDASTYARLVSKRRAKGLPSVSALFLDGCGELTDQQSANEIVKKAVKAAEKKKVGDMFRLKDLFPIQHWEAFPKPARINAGKAFNALVSSAPWIEEAHKSASNHQYYRVRAPARSALN